MATQKRMIGIPAEVNKPWANSTIAWGTGITKTPVPPSVSNPASLTPWVTTPQPIAPKPVYGNNTAGINAVNQWAKNVNLNPDWTHKVTPAPTTITWATPRTWLPAQPWMLDINDPNNYNLTGYTVDDFLKLDPASQIKANAFGESQNKDLLGTTNDLRYTNEVNANKDFLDKQNTINQETAKLNNQNAEIQRQQNMRAEEKSVRDLAQNVWFLWSQGRPVQSTWMMNAYADAINESNQKLSEIRTIQDNMRSMQELWIEFDANQYTEQIRRLNQDLKDKTWQVFQDAINAYNAEERAWMIDSPSKMLKLQQEILARADFSVAWFVQKNLDDIRVMNDNITSHIEAVKVEAAQAEVLRKEQAQTQAEFVKNQNTVNKDMSQALWHYVNGNWQALTTTEGAIIPFAKDMPNPSYDPNTWVAVVRQADAQGNPVPVIQQIAPMSQDYKMWLQLKQAQLNKIQQETASTGWNIVNTQIANPNTQISIAQYSQQQRGRTTLQCGELVNDYIKKESGTKWSLGNSFADKVAWIDKIGRSVSPVVWGIFAFDVKTSQGNTWHTGIVTWVNPDWSINVLEANRKENSANGWIPSQGTYSPAQVSNMVFSQAPKNNNLSSVAKEAVKSWQINWTPTVQSGIIKELADSGEFDKWQGNSTFYTAKPAIKDEIASFAEWYAKRQQAKDIFNKLKADWTLWGATWWFDTLANKGKRFAGAWSTDVNNLNQILAESLSKYMNKISGATVSETEVERLREQIPNLSMWDKQFIDAFEQYDQSMQRWLDNTLTKYWFNSYDDVKQKIYWDNKSEQPASTTWTNPYAQYQKR